MNRCDEYAIKTLRYLDNELEELELKDFLLHLDSCASCRARVQAEKDLTATLHRARPLYSAPAALRDRVAAAVVQNPTSSPVDGSIPHPASRPGRRSSWSPKLLANWRVLAPAAVAIALCLAIVPSIEHQVQAASYVETAVTSHRNYVNGDLQQELKSNSPGQVTAWFAGKVPFDFRLPGAESEPGNSPAYWLTGATLVNYKGSPAALVMYETLNDKISLLVESSNAAVVAGGDEIRFGKLIFHYHNESGFRVITWSNHGLSYALVSSVSGPAQASCFVCHQSMKDKATFRPRP
jgi:anti-sigma factor RsiW